MSYSVDRPGPGQPWRPDFFHQDRAPVRSPTSDAPMILTSNRDQNLEVRPQSFVGLMDLYERNYIGIRRLVPTPPAAGESLVSVVPGALDLHLTVMERFRYTTELHLTYLFAQPGSEPHAEPDLYIRVYHDARQAEVTAARLRHRPDFVGEAWDRQPTLRSRWHVNRFLYKWLNYCLYQGHRLSPGDQP